MNYPALSSSLVITISGDILSTNADALRSDIFQQLKALETGARAVEIDLRPATMVDSVGLNLLVAVIKMVKRYEGTVQLTVGNNNVERTFRFTRLDAQAKVVRG